MKLRYYETLYLLHPDLSDEDREAISEKLQLIITERGGRIVKVDPWSLRKLAYKVQKQSQGYYVLMEYGATAESISEITRTLRLDESVMKFFTQKKEDEFDYEMLSKPDEEVVEAAGVAEEMESTEAVEGE